MSLLLALMLLLLLLLFVFSFPFRCLFCFSLCFPFSLFAISLVVSFCFSFFAFRYRLLLSLSPLSFLPRRCFPPRCPSSLSVVAFRCCLRLSLPLFRCRRGFFAATPYYTRTRMRIAIGIAVYTGTATTQGAVPPNREKPQSRVTFPVSFSLFSALVLILCFCQSPIRCWFFRHWVSFRCFSTRWRFQLLCAVVFLWRVVFLFSGVVFSRGFLSFPASV